jgi:hypothetical protein
VKAADGKPHTLQTREAEQQQAREQQAAQEAQEKAAESPTA